MRVKAMESAIKYESAGPLSGDVETLFRDHHARILRTAFRITGDPMEAEDVLQTLFLRLLHKKQDTQFRQSPGAYLNRAAVNLALDCLRKRVRQVDIGDMRTELSDTRPSPDRDARSAELKSWLRSALARLNPKAAEIFALHHFEGLSNREIAKIVGMSWGSVAVTLHRTHLRLRKELQSNPGGKS